MEDKRCSTCHEVRPLDDFNVRRAAHDGRQDRCRDCARRWYLQNKNEHMRRVRDRNKRVRAENQELLANYLLAHPCVDCGEADVRVLDFDHEDPAKKTQEVGRLSTFGLPWSRILTEIEKCSVRCANCHRRRTSAMSGWWRSAVEERRQQCLHERAAERLRAVLAPPG